jgi:hypothetical protein
MSKVLRMAVVVFSFTVCGCGGVSKDFKREAGYLYYLLSARGGQTLQRDFDTAMARAEAAKSNEADKKAMFILELYANAIQYSDGGPFDKRLVEVCQWEAAEALETEAPFIEKRPSTGDCGMLVTARAERGAFVDDCTNRDPELSKLKAREKNGGLAIMQLRMSKEKEVREHCKGEADAKFPPI